jgi:3-dehydroquinate synthase
VIAIGGGAVLDAAGYAAATAHRGIRLIRVPTTVLAQDDSAMGVKNGVNAFGKKNYLGTFAPPFAVINDSTFLTTLSDRDWRAGVSEAIKAALIKDRSFFDFLEQHAASLRKRDSSAMEQVIRRCAALHLTHIATGGDPFELGSSRPLDFGHWSAHKLEQLTHHRLGHGEAVGVGIALDTTYSYLAGYLPEDDWRRIISLLPAMGLSVYVPELEHDLHVEDAPSSVLRGLDEFREHLGGALTILMLRFIGAPFDVHEIRRDVMIRSIGVLRDFERAQRLREQREERHDRHIPSESSGTGR